MEEAVVTELTVLAVPDCPNAPVIQQRLAGLVAGRPDVTVTRRDITELADATRWGMHGSPTLLVDGRDPFAAWKAPLLCPHYVRCWSKPIRALTRQNDSPVGDAAGPAGRGRVARLPPPRGG